MNETLIRTALRILQTPGAVVRIDAIDLSSATLPDQIRLRLDTPLVKGGGSLILDKALGGYAGALAISLPMISIDAIAILATEHTGQVESWSLLVIMASQWPAPLPLVYGFTLSGVGGLVGLNRGVSQDRLTNEMNAGALDTVLFPGNVGSQSGELIKRLQDLFPVQDGTLTIGPLLKIGWGFPNLIQARLAVLVPVRNALSRGGLSLDSVALLGQVEARLPAGISADKALLRLLVDVVGHLNLVEQTFGFVARLRDSRIGLVELTGMLVLQVRWGDQPSFVLAAGGFHPRFADIPPGVPTPIDRIGNQFAIGSARVALSGYFAITPTTVQAGGRIYARASAAGASIEGEFSFDTLFEFDPVFRFVIDASCRVTARWHGNDICGVGFKGRLTGPGPWTFVGQAEFDVWLATISIPIDATWGSAPAPAPLAPVDLEALLRQDLSNPDLWGTPDPDAATLICLSGEPDSGCVLAHPLAPVSFRQHRFPLDLRLQHYGRAPIKGRDILSIVELQANGKSLLRQTLLEAFARSAFVEVSQDDQLAGPSFEHLPAGVRGMPPSHALAEGIQVPLEYEMFYANLTPEEVEEPPISRSTVPYAKVRQQALFSGYGRSPLGFRRRARPADAPLLQVKDVPLVRVTSDTHQAQAPLREAARFAPTLARQRASDGLVIEQYETWTRKP